MTIDTPNPKITLPRRFLRALKKAGSERELSRRTGVNISYISQLVSKGIEPSNPEIRVKLGLSRRNRKPRHARPPKPEHVKRVDRAVRKMVRDTKQAIADSQ